MCLSVYLLTKKTKQTKCRLMKEKKGEGADYYKKTTSERKAYWRVEVIQRDDLIELFFSITLS